MAASRWLFTKQQILNTPSRKHGIDQDKELSYRQQAANLIQDMGQRLQVTQLCINTAIVYMHRFYMFQSFKRFPRNDIAPACLFLAAKVEEQPRKLEHVIRVSHTCLHRDHTPPPDPKSEYYLESAHLLVVNENILLQTLGFDVSVDHPHTIVVKTTELVKASKDLAQTSYFLATNSLHLTALCLQYRPATVACICIHLACKWSNWKIPLSNEGKEWHYYVDRTVTVELLEEINKEFLEIMDKCPHKLRKKIMGWKAGNREALYEGEGRQSPVNTMRRPTPESSSTDLRKHPQTSSHDPNRPGQSSSQPRFTNHDRKDGPMDVAHPFSDHRAGADKKQSENKDEHLSSERKEGQVERKDPLVDKRFGHSAQSHLERDVNRHDRKEVPPDRKDRSDMLQHRKESYDRRDIQAKDRHQERKDLERKDYPVKREGDEGRFHGKEGHVHGNMNRPPGRDDRNIFQTVGEKLGPPALAQTEHHKPVTAGDLPRKAVSETALSTHHPPSSVPTTGKYRQEQTPLNYREYLLRKEREKEMLSQSEATLNKTFTQGSERSKVVEGERSKHRPPHLNMSLPSEILAGKAKTDTSEKSIQRNRSLSGDRNQNNNGRQHNIVIKSPVKPHHNITVKSPIASSELKDFHIDVQKLSIPLTPEKPGSDPFTVNIKRDTSGQELMKHIKQEPGVSHTQPDKPDWVKIKIKSEPMNMPVEKGDLVKTKSKPELTHSVPEKIDVAKSKLEQTKSIPEKGGIVGTKIKRELASPPPEKIDIVKTKSKAELTNLTSEKIGIDKSKPKLDMSRPPPEKIGLVRSKPKLEQSTPVPEKIDIGKSKPKSDVSSPTAEKIGLVRSKSKLELSTPGPEKIDIGKSKPKSDLSCPTAEKIGIVRSKSKLEQSGHIQEKTDIQLVVKKPKLDLSSPALEKIDTGKSKPKSDLSSPTEEKIDIGKSKPKLDISSPTTETVGLVRSKSKLELTSPRREKIDIVKSKPKLDRSSPPPEKSNLVRSKSKLELTGAIPEKIDTVKSKPKLNLSSPTTEKVDIVRSKSDLIASAHGKIDSVKVKVEPTVAHSQPEKLEPVKIRIKTGPTEETDSKHGKPESESLDSASLDNLQQMKLKLKEELEMANSPSKSPKVPVLPANKVPPVPSERTTPKILADKVISHIPPEKSQRNVPHRPDKSVPQMHSEKKKVIPDIAVPKMPPEKAFPNMPNISVKTNQSLPKVRKIRTEPVIQTIPDEIPKLVKHEPGLPPEDILKHKLKSDLGHNRLLIKTEGSSKHKIHTEQSGSADKHRKHVVHGASRDSNGPGPVIQLKPEHTGSEQVKLKIPELNINPDVERSPSLKISIKTDPGSGHSTPVMSVKSDPGSGANTPIKMLLKRDTSQSGEKSPLKVKISTTGTKPDGEKMYRHGELGQSSSHGHGKHKDKHRKHKHKDRHKERHREHREKREHAHATSELNGDKPGIKLSIKIPPQSSSSSELVHHRHSSKHDKHRRTSVSDTALNKNQNATSESERHQPWSMNELDVRPHADSPARKRRRTPTVDQTSDLSLQPSQNKAPKTEPRGRSRLRRSSSSHSVVSMEISDNEACAPSTAEIKQPQQENQMEKIKLQLQQAIEQQSRQIQEQLKRQKSGFDIDSYMNASTSRLPLGSDPPLPPTPPSSQTSIASPPPPPPR